MAKTTKTAATVTKPKTRHEKVAQEIKKIRAFFRLGRQAPRRRLHRMAYGKRLIDAEAERLGVNEDTLRKARQFREEYGRDGLKQLCQLIREKQSGMERDRPVFSTSHLIRLLTVADKDERELLQREAVAGAWSRQRLNVEIAKRYGPRRDAGRRPYVPPDLGGAYAKIESFCEGFRRWLEELAREDAAGEHVVLEDLPAWVRKKVREAGQVLERLQEAVTRELKKEWPDRELRKAQRDEPDEAAASNRKGRR